MASVQDLGDILKHRPLEAKDNGAHVEWQPSVGFGLTLIASAFVLFFSVAHPESQVRVMVWYLLSIRRRQKSPCAVNAIETQTDTLQLLMQSVMVLMLIQWS